MKILLLNDAYFLASLKVLRHEVFFVSPAPGADHIIGQDPVDIRDVLKACPFLPDVILLSDSINYRAAFTGLEGLEIPTVFYGVDSPMNAFWQLDFSSIFDLTFLDQKEPVVRLHSQRRREMSSVQWLPLGADHRLYQRLPVAKKYDLAFVGTLHTSLRPKRSWVLQELARNFNIAIFDGQGRRSLTPPQVVEIYNQSRLVINENLFPGLNLRLLEMMSCGACVLTEESDSSWRSYFNEDEHLIVYNSANLVQKVQLYLRDEERRQTVADAGMAIVQARHTIDYRAKTLLRESFKLVRRLETIGRRPKSIFDLGKAYLALASRWREQPVGKLATEAVRLLCQEALQGRENAELHFELAARALREGRREDAASSLQRALQIDPAHLRSVWALFWCFREKGNHLQAATELSRLCHHVKIEISRRFLLRLRSGEDLGAEAYHFLGLVLEKAGWIIECGVDRFSGHPCRWNAYDAWQKAIHLDSTLPDPLQKCAAVLENGPAPEFAVPYLEKLVDLQPLYSDARFRLAVLLMNNYQREKGLKHLLQFLFTSDEGSGWDRVEKLKLTETEWNYLLDSVLDYSRKKEDGKTNGFVRDFRSQLQQYFPESERALGLCD